MTRPLVSVCLPTYNGEIYLREAIESVLNQTVHDLELVIGDDRSNQATRTLLEEFAQRDPRVKLTVNEQNMGYVPNCAAIMRRCQGKFIKNFAQDDTLEPDCIERMLAVMQQYPNVTLVTSARTLIDEDGVITGVHHHFDKTQLFSGKEIIKLYLKEFVNRTGNPTQIFFRGEHIENGFNPAYHHGEDVEFGLRLLEKGDYYYIDDPLIKYRIHKATTTMSTLVDMSFAPDHVRAIDQFGKYALEDGVTLEEIWDAAIKGLIIKMSNALYVRGITYDDDFPTPKYFGHPEVADKNYTSEPELFRRLACQLLKYSSQQNHSWQAAKSYVSARFNSNSEQTASAVSLDYIQHLEKELEKLKSKDAELTEAKEKLLAQEAEIASLKASSSWKITAPLRKLRNKKSP